MVFTAYQSAEGKNIPLTKMGCFNFDLHGENGDSDSKEILSEPVDMETKTGTKTLTAKLGIGVQQKSQDRTWKTRLGNAHS